MKLECLGGVASKCKALDDIISTVPRPHLYTDCDRAAPGRGSIHSPGPITSTCPALALRLHQLLPKLVEKASEEALECVKSACMTLANRHFGVLLADGVKNVEICLFLRAN